jgi:hypothetical protein
MNAKRKKVQRPEIIENDQKDVNSINEPAAIYSSPKTLHFFSSFVDENDATARLNAQLTPEEHLKNAHAIILKLYEKELQQVERPSYNITFVIKDGIPC